MKKTILIGAARPQKLPALVCEHSIWKHTKLRDIRIVHTFHRPAPEPKTPDKRSRTGFTFWRFALPAEANYEGVGIYFDSDMLVMADVQELFDLQFYTATVLRPRNQAAVLVVDCDHVRWDVNRILEDLDAGRISYEALVHDLGIEARYKIHEAISDFWNCRDACPDGAKNVHWTRMTEQPWRHWGHPLGGLWINALRDAIDDGVISKEVMLEETQSGHIVPEVLRELRWGS